jgi:hypothetical protein
MDWTKSLYGYLGDSAASAPGTTTIPLSTPVNTSGNPNNSGSSFGSFFSGLGNFGTTAAQAYATVRGAKPSSGPAATYSGPSSIALNLPSWAKWAIGAGIAIGIIVLGVVLFRKGK